MIWVSWRQTRATAAVLAVVSAALAAYLVRAGIHVRAAYTSSGVGHCLRPLASAPQSACFGTLAQFNDAIGATSYGTGGAFLLYLNLVPGLFGAFLGAPLLGREFEHGTQRFAWNQSVTRKRWLAHRLLVGGAVAVLAELIISVAATYARSPIDRLDGHFLPDSFNLEGIAPLGFVLFAFTLGVAAGALIRRTVPAIAVTVVMYVAVKAKIQGLRAHYLPAKSVVNTTIAFQTPDGGRGSWDRSWDLSFPHGHTVYQPASRYWPFQFVEFGIYLCLSAVFVAVAIHTIQRRASTH
jgi:hypothetical protein